ncbi:AMP-binding protein [Arthrobacter globiformis]|uniref:AMP-binding protein n=1 Tax=Arthrobacter globiformis TaxID=1665 RepID=UPI002793B4DA|nr:AMP-binding protein [Arthrobacter globiformis]MDQ0616699.1 fatty-acyl-CoA synthase [Arthrobacter globiformis]
MKHLTQSYWSSESIGELCDTTIPQLLRAATAEAPDRVALVDGQKDPASRRSWTYAELLAHVEEVSQALLQRFEPGERVAIWSSNCVEWLFLQYGAAMAGLVLVTVNPAFRDRELEHVLRQSEAAGVVFGEEYRGFDTASAIQRIRPGLEFLREAIPIADWENFVADGSRSVRTLPEVHPDDPAQIQFTSGTTGAPKGAMLHHKGLVNSSRFVGQRSEMAGADVWINSMPLFHVGASGIYPFATFDQRGTYVLMPGFEPGLFLELVEAYRGTITVLVPTMLRAVLAHEDLARTDLSTMRTVLSGASVVPAELVRQTKAAFRCKVGIHFGQTELHGILTQTYLDDDDAHQSETIGQPMPHMEVKIIDPVAGTTLPVGETGEIVARGYQAMLGYYGRPEDTAQTIDAEGWLHTGDLASMDSQGYLTITGRLKDMIIRGGENIYPREIEDLLLGYPGILDACVLGMPDEHWGERVVAIVRASDTGEVGPEELTEYCRAHMARYKVPVEWHFTRDFPMTASGKIQKFLLRQRISGKMPAV